jgi:8-oxo-dGTP diphosphatase
LDVNDIRLVGVYSTPQRHPKQVINLLYLVEIKEADVKFADDAVDAKWFSLDSLPKKIAFDHKQNIKDALIFLKK